MGDALFSYEIDVPVTVPREQSAMIPFLSADVQCERITVYNSQTHSKHPFLGVALTNDSGLHLMGGPITVFAPATGGSSGYTGQALIDDTEPGQKRLLTYAVDVAVTVAMKHQHLDKEILNVAIEGGILETRCRHIHTTTYVATNHDETSRTLVIEHDTSSGGWQLIDPLTADEVTGSHYRFYRPIEPRSGTTLVVREEDVTTLSTVLKSVGFNQIKMVSGYDAATPQLGTAIQSVLSVWNEILRTETAIESMRKQLADIDAQQSRIRQNLAAIDHGTDLYRRYIAQLDAQETSVTKLTDDIASAEADLQGKREQLDVTIAAIEL